MAGSMVAFGIDYFSIQRPTTLQGSLSKRKSKSSMPAFSTSGHAYFCPKGTDLLGLAN